MDFASLHREAVTSGSWPQAIITVAWGNAPGNRSHGTRLAEGQTHLRHGLPRVNMAFGQTISTPVPHSWYRIANLAHGSQLGSKPSMRSGSPMGTNIKTGTRAISPGLSTRLSRPERGQRCISPVRQSVGELSPSAPYTRCWRHGKIVAVLGSRCGSDLSFNGGAIEPWCGQQWVFVMCAGRFCPV